MFWLCWPAARGARAASGGRSNPLSTRSVSFEPRAVRLAAFGAAQKSGPVDSTRRDAATCPPAPPENPLRGSRPTWAVWAPRRRRPPDRSALLRFFDSQSNIAPPPAAAGAAPQPVGREGDDAGAHATVADALHRASIGPQLHHRTVASPGATRARETTAASQPTHATQLP